MLRRLIRPGAAVGAVLASLALAASAQAAPTTPHLTPLPYYVCSSSLGVSWTHSTPDPGGQIIAYRLDIGDLSTGTATYKYVAGLSSTINGLIANHHYVVRVRALQLKGNVWSYSGSSGDTFVRQCIQISDEILNRYVAYNPWPECIMCGGLAELFSDDPVIQRAIRTGVAPAPERFGGTEIDARGDMSIVGG